MLALCMAAPAFAQDTSVNVNWYTIPELPSVPIIDGDLSDPVWANVPTIPMDKNGDSPAAVPGSGDLDIILKIAWDDETNALYFAVNVIDDSLTLAQGLGSTAGTGGWNNERLEVVLDGTNTGDAASTTTSGFHQQYTFDMPNTWDPYDPAAGLYGLFNVESPNALKVTTQFTQVPVYERVEGSLNLNNSHAPWNIADEYIESAARIRATNPASREWIEAPVEYNWEVKIVPFEFLVGASTLGYDLANPANIASGWKSYWEDPTHDKLDLKQGIVIGCSPQQNDADIWGQTPAREHQTNTTGVAGNWNSSESLTGLILGPRVSTSVADWSIQ
jgi:hypothetical protein